mgnify:CR=1 FL=1
MSMWAALALSVMAPAQVIEVPREFRAAWVATVDNIDWPSKRGLTVDQQKAELRRIVDTAAALKLNALVFQVRPHADAMYQSDLEPWSIYLSGTPGRAPSPAYDPLKTIIELAHARGIQIHAWFNPYRAWHPAAKATANASHVVKTRPQGVRDYGTFKWMDPSDPWVQNRTLEVMKDVVRRYDVDGIHIDDYFYPYPVRADGKLVDFPDEVNYKAYQAKGGKLGRADWRRKQVDDMVQRIYTETKKVKPWIQFGISPFGIYRPGVPAGISAGVDQYDQLYADAKKWLEKGWCDYMSPQLYWPIAQQPQSFPVLLNWWLSVNPKGRHVWPGLYTGRLGPDNWPVQEITDQIDLTRERGADGHVHFSFKTFLQNTKGINETLKGGHYREFALAPASPWLSKAPVPAPKSVRRTADGITFATPGSNVHFAVVFNDKKVVHIQSARAGRVTLPGNIRGQSGLEYGKLAFVDRAGVLGPAVEIPR